MVIIWGMKVWINLIVVTILQHIHASNHHIGHLSHVYVIGRYLKEAWLLALCLEAGCFGIYLCRCLRGFLGARLWAPLCLTPHLPHPWLTLPGTEGLGSRMSVRVWSTGTSGCSQNWERVLLFFRSSFSWQNLWALSGFWRGLKSLSPSSLTKFLLVCSNREGMMLGAQRGAHSSFGRKGATSDRSLMFERTW